MTDNGAWRLTWNCIRLILSDLFMFYIGTEKKPFRVHSDPLAKQSTTLDTLINGSMMEANIRATEWPDVDADTFTRFCEFCYLGDYTPPDYKTVAYDLLPSFNNKSKKKGKKKKRFASGWEDSLSPEPESAAAPEEAPVEEAAPEWDEPVPEESAASVENEVPEEAQIYNDRIANGSKHLAKYRLHQLLSSDEYPLPDSYKRFADRFIPFSNTSSRQDFTPVFLGHARLYVLADKYDVQPLKELVLHKLHQTLKSFSIYTARVVDLINLVRFAYSDESTPTYNDRVDDLRKLVVHYVATTLESIAESEPFMELLQDGGDFVKDFWRVVWSKASG